MSKKIKLLFLAANPTKLGSQLRLDEELHQISKNIRINGGGDSFEIFSEWAVRPNDLQGAVLRYRPHIVHISAHSSKKSGIILERDDLIKNSFSLEDESEEERLQGVSKQSLAKLFHTLKGNIRLVFLNLCYTKNYAKAISRFIDYSIGMNAMIGDKEAIIFSSSFYGHLASGLPINTSFDLAVNHLELLNISRAISPVLLVREGINSSESFLSKSQKNLPALKIGQSKQYDANNSMGTWPVRVIAGDSPVDIKKNRKKKKKAKANKF